MTIEKLEQIKKMPEYMALTEEQKKHVDEKMIKSAELEKRAISLWRKNHFLLSLNPDAKKFFSEIAELIDWQNLTEELKR